METLPERNPENLDWNADTEVQLFHAMKGHKPVGVNRYFQMACIHQKFSASINKEISSQTIWEHLDTMYDMAALHESEILPFPNPENEFVLPDKDFADLLSKRRGKNAAQLNDSEPTKRASSPAPKASPAAKQSRTAADEEKPVSASRRPEATGGKTGKGDWNAAKFSPVPSAGGKVRRNEVEAARTGGKAKSDSLRRSESATSSPAPSPGGKVKPEHAHGKVKSESSSRKSDAGGATPSATSKSKSEGSKAKGDAPKKATDSRSDAKQDDAKQSKRTDSEKRTKGEGRGESKGDGKADSKSGSGGGSKADAGKRNDSSAKSKESGRKSEGRAPRNEEAASNPAKGSAARVKEEPESSPKRKRASRLDQPKAASPLVGGHSKRRR